MLLSHREVCFFPLHPSPSSITQNSFPSFNGEQFHFLRITTSISILVQRTDRLGKREFCDINLHCTESYPHLTSVQQRGSQRHQIPPPSAPTYYKDEIHLVHLIYLAAKPNTLFFTEFVTSDISIYRSAKRENQRVGESVRGCIYTLTCSVLKVLYLSIS